MYNIPALLTVAGVAYFKSPISNISLILSFKGILSLLANVNTLLSSITVFRDSIHIGSMSPSSKIHLLSLLPFEKSLITVLNNPSFHSLVDGFMNPNNSSFVTAFGSKSAN
eukprot:NODE_74_length_23402_cov_1.166974.p10 type:complete len:111 gc:universal NODE_74_length_23402_cov_1.166974:13153-13485(+)